MSNHLYYLDSLRGYAIFMVLVFHFFNQFMPAGYIGVDIFFVISGFIITKMLVSDIKKPQPFIVNFYIRRLLRLFPGLLMLFLICLVLGFFFLLPSEYELLAKHLNYATFFGSNFLLHSEVGYFDVSAKFKPLLHLWSLSIEEQFYIFWPFALLFLSQKSVKTNLVYLSTLFLFSLTICLHYSYVNNQDAFYFPWSRAWELLVGSITYYIGLLKSNHENNSYKKSNFAVTLSMAVIIIFAMCYRGYDKYPSWVTLVPVIATSLVIYFCSKCDHKIKILNFPVVIFLGLISYSLYIYHWTVLSMYQILIGTPTLKASILLLSSVIVLSVISHFFFEKPIRDYGKKKLLSGF